MNVANHSHSLLVLIPQSCIVIAKLTTASDKANPVNSSKGYGRALASPILSVNHTLKISLCLTKPRLSAIVKCIHKSQLLQNSFQFTTYYPFVYNNSNHKYLRILVSLSVHDPICYFLF